MELLQAKNVLELLRNASDQNCLWTFRISLSPQALLNFSHGLEAADVFKPFAQATNYYRDESNLDVETRPQP